MTSNLDTIETSAIEEEFGPADMPANATQLPPNPPCPGEPDPQNCVSDVNHRWCRLGTPDEVTPRDVLPDTRNGDAGSPSTVEFFFTPRMDFGYDLIPGPFGLMQFNLGATAALTAGAEVHVLGADERLDVVDFLLEVRGGLHDADDDMQDICGVRTGNSHVIILEQADILPASFKLNLPSDELQEDCIAGLKEFQETANRVKKAYSDARELLRQYKELKAGGSNFGVGLDGLCDQIASDLPYDFPIGEDCLTEPPGRDAQPIHRLLRLPREGTADGPGRQTRSPTRSTRRSARPTPPSTSHRSRTPRRSSSSSAVLHRTHSGEPAGPVHGQLRSRSNGIEVPAEQLGAGDDGPGPSARAATIPSPMSVRRDAHAGAGLALFVGVGFDFGIAAAKIGIEGSVSLGPIGLPIEGGAGVAIAPSRTPARTTAIPTT